MVSRSGPQKVTTKRSVFNLAKKAGIVREMGGHGWTDMLLTGGHRLVCTGTVGN